MFEASGLGDEPERDDTHALSCTVPVGGRQVACLSWADVGSWAAADAQIGLARNRVGGTSSCLPRSQVQHTCVGRWVPYEHARRPTLVGGRKPRGAS